MSTTTPLMPLDCDGFADALADYLEGDAPDGVRAAVDAHASSCAACRQLLADLDGLRADAAQLPPLAPSRDLWTGIAERIDARVLPMETPRTIQVRKRPWLRPAAAAAALVIVTAGITHYATRASLAPASAVRTASIGTAGTALSTQPPASEPTGEITSTATEQTTPARGATRRAADGTTRLVSAEPAMDAAEPVFASEIGKLKKIVRERRSQLDPKTVAVLEQSIAVIDSAIAQSRAALVKDPASGFLATQLNHSLETKVELLRTAASLPSRT
jgi:anti-sigma factor RsiW